MHTIKVEPGQRAETWASSCSQWWRVHRRRECCLYLRDCTSDICAYIRQRRWVNCTTSAHPCLTFHLHQHLRIREHRSITHWRIWQLAVAAWYGIVEFNVPLDTL